MTSLALPPFIMTSEENSFARNTIASRKPLIIDQILVDNDYPPDIQGRLLNLKAELLSGQIRLLEDESEDKTIWDHDMRPWLGKSWLEIPWFLAETYFFRRVLEATGYFQPGPWHCQDPYRLLKVKEFNNALPQFTSVYGQMIDERSLTGFHQAVLNALWGNQADLSNLDRSISNSHENPKQLLRDDSAKVFGYLKKSPVNMVYFMDNVGKELYFDLALMDYLLQNKMVSSITALLKNQPFFVSDAMIADFEQALGYLENSSEKPVQQLAHRTRKALQQGTLLLKAPPFLTTGRMYRQLPVEQKAQIRKADLVILKGDVNYRRLVGDRHWDPSTPIGRAAGYFPASFMSLRTLKAELVVGLKQEQLNGLKKDAEPDWMTSGKWGLITFLKK